MNADYFERVALRISVALAMLIVAGCLALAWALAGG